MESAYFKTKSSGLAEVYCTPDGKIDFSALGVEFGFDPTSIKLNGKRFPEEGLISRATWAEIKNEFTRRVINDGTEVKPVMVTGVAPVPAVSTDEFVDRSEEWIKLMLLPELPELPRNKAELTNVLFPPGHIQKLPVTKMFYRSHKVRTPVLVEEHLIESDDSMLSSTVSVFLNVQSDRSQTEMDTTLIVASSLHQFFNTIDEYTKNNIPLNLAFNSTETAVGSHSATTVLRSRPDTILIASACTLLVGEDKLNDLAAAETDLRRKIKPLNKMYYGDLQFIVGYIAAGRQFQWLYIGWNGSIDLIGRPLNLSKLADRCSYVLSLGYVFQLFQKMAASLPHVPGRRAMFSKEESSSKRRIIYFYPTKVKKHIVEFYTYSSDQGTSLPEIKRAYEAASGHRCLLQATKGPSVTRDGTYRVTCFPLGYSCLVESEQDCRWMAKCVCQALAVLHKAGLVHRDIRLPNIVRLSGTEFMLIDFESVATFPFRVPEGFQHFSGWCAGTLEGSLYTPFSDMICLGQLLKEALPSEMTSPAEDFVKRLINKEMSASDALSHPWLLRGPIASLVS